MSIGGDHWLPPLLDTSCFEIIFPFTVLVSSLFLFLLFTLFTALHILSLQLKNEAGLRDPSKTYLKQDSKVLLLRSSIC